MLREIMKVFRGDEPSNLTELASRLDVERSALNGMLETLVRQGKLRRVASADSACRACQQRTGCAGCSNNPELGIRYELVSHEKGGTDVHDR